MVSHELSSRFANNLNFLPPLVAIGLSAFLFIAPLYSLILLAFVLIFVGDFPDRLALLYACFVVSILVYLRDYGIAWNAEALDDAPRWASIFIENSQSGITVVFDNFLQRPSEHEVLYWLFYWFVGQVTNNPRIFVILNIAIGLLLVSFALRNLYGRYALIILLGYLLIFPVSLYSLANVYRQQMAFSIFIFAISLILTHRHTRTGNILLLVVPLIHLSTILYVSLYYMYRISVNDKQRFLLMFIFISLIYIITNPEILSMLQFKGIADKIIYYTEYIDRSGRNIKEFGALLVSLTIFLLARKKGAENLAVISFIVAGSILVSTTVLHDYPRIVDRILIFVLPLLSIMLCRAILLAWGPAWGSVSLLGGFFLSTQFPERGHGIFDFLAFGDFFSWFSPLVSLFQTGAMRGI